MKLRPVRHSNLLKLAETEQQALTASGVFIVQDQFYDLLNDQSQILILPGSYGSGKSFFAADLLIKKCVEDTYFRCFYGRKILKKVKESVFTTLVEQIEKHRCDGFSYSTADNSTMVIKYKNGNRFNPFGADDVDGLKSIKEPSHFFLEELDQFTAEDFGMCLSRLGRTNKARTQLIALCNTDKVYPEHWLHDILFGENKIGATIHWSNFRNNTLLPSVEEYEKILRIKAMGDEDVFNSIANSAPAIRNRQNAWIYIDYSGSIINTEIAFIPGNTVYLSFDFNNEPLTCTAWQMSSGRHRMDGAGAFIHAIAEFEASMATSDEEIISLLCKKIKAAFPYNPLRITGDSNGRVRLKGVAGNKSAFYLIAKYLNVHENNIDVNAANLPHTISRRLCNTWMYNHKNIRISTVNTPKLVADIRIAKASETEQDKLVKDRKINKLDFFDTFRYIPATYFTYFIDPE